MIVNSKGKPLPTIVSWSPSRVDMHKKCNLMFYEIALLQSVPYVESAQQAEGNRVHAMLDKRIKKEIVLEPAYAHLEPLVASIENAPGQTYSEQKMTINNRFETCGWFDKDAWCRLVVDVMKINGPVGFMGDWKTGKPRFDDYQLKLNAALGFIYYPSLQTITTAYIWLKTKTLDPATYRRADLDQIWAELLQEPTKMQQNLANNTWAARPGWQCSYCGVNKQRRCSSAQGPYRGD